MSYAGLGASLPEACGSETPPLHQHPAVQRGSRLQELRLVLLALPARVQADLAERAPNLQKRAEYDRSDPIRKPYKSQK